MEVGEVLPIANYVTLSHFAEQSIGKHGHDEKDQHKEDEDVNQRAN